jgi:hypothetical protein
MALIVEDGSIVLGAQAYISAAEADAYFASRFEVAWAGLTTDEKERHLILGALYIDNESIWVYSGSRMQISQPLTWPRVRATYWRSGPDIPENTILIETKRANAEAALLSSKGAIPTQKPDGGVAGTSDIQTEKVGDISVTYFDPFRSSDGSTGSAAGGVLAYSELAHPLIAGILTPILDEGFYADIASVTDGKLDAPVKRVDASRRGALLVSCRTRPLFTIGQFDNRRVPVQLPAASPLCDSNTAESGGGGTSPNPRGYPDPSTGSPGEALVINPQGEPEFGADIDAPTQNIDSGGF